MIDTDCKWCKKTLAKRKGLCSLHAGRSHRIWNRWSTIRGRKCGQ